MQENEAIQTEEQEPTEVVELEEEVKESESEQSAAPIEDISEEETKADAEQDELEDYSKNVQKRISTLTKKMREQERAAQSAYEYAKNLQAENEAEKKKAAALWEKRGELFLDPPEAQPLQEQPPVYEEPVEETVEEAVEEESSSEESDGEDKPMEDEGSAPDTN